MALALTIISVSLIAYEWQLGANNVLWVYKLSELFSIQQEVTIPTWYSTLLWASVAVCALLIALHHRNSPSRDRFVWWGLVILFTFLSADEGASIHELFTNPMRETFNLTGFLYFGWVVVYVPITILLGALILPFVWRLPARVRWTIIAGGIIFLLGAVVIESISAIEWERFDDRPSLLYSGLSGIEEFCEMLGVILVQNALLVYLRDHVREIRFHW